MDIGSNHGGLSARLSNFQARSFVLDPTDSMLPARIRNAATSAGETRPWVCSSLEGALQALKFDKPRVAESVCSLVGMQAKRRGRGRNREWKRRQKLWIFGVSVDRKSDEMWDVHRYLYASLWVQNASFRDDLRATGDAVLRHSMGRRDERETVLTEREFCRLLTWLRGCEDEGSVRRQLETDSKDVLVFSW